MIEIVAGDGRDEMASKEQRERASERESRTKRSARAALGLVTAGVLILLVGWLDDRRRDLPRWVGPSPREEL